VPIAAQGCVSAFPLSKKVDSRYCSLFLQVLEVSTGMHPARILLIPLQSHVLRKFGRESLNESKPQSCLNPYFSSFVHAFFSSSFYRNHPLMLYSILADTMDIVTESSMKPENGAFTSPLSAHKLPLDGSSYSIYDSDSDASQSDSEVVSAVLASATSKTPASPPSLSSVQPSPEPEIYVTAAESFAGLSLADAMPRYKIRLEREKDAALARNEPRQPPRRPVDDSQPSLDSILVPHKSKLEKDKEAAIAENNPRKPPSRKFEDQPSLDSVLVPHKSRLQREKEAAQAANEPRRPAVHNIENEQPSLDSMLKKTYSRVEREKQAAAAAAAAAAADPSTATAIRPPRSRLQMEREASARLAEKSKIQDEEIAAAKAAEAEIAAAAAAEAAAIAAEEAEGAAAAAALLESPVAERGEELYDSNMIGGKITEAKAIVVPVAAPPAVVVEEAEEAAEDAADIPVAEAAEEEEEEEEEAAVVEEEVIAALAEAKEQEEEIPAVDTDVAVAEEEEEEELRIASQVGEDNVVNDEEETVIVEEADAVQLEGKEEVVDDISIVHEEENEDLA
jgi:hypothetical protein